MDNKNLYTDKSIESLSPLEFTRLRPGVYCGDTTYSTQLLIEIFSNAVDEHRLGHGDEIVVTIAKNPYCITVCDQGQGFLPMVTREDDKTILEAAFSVLNTSGKYREEGVYEGTSLGSFGIGSKITNYLSHQLKATTYRAGKFETVYFVEGEFNKRESGTCDPQLHGVEVTWFPSEEFFTHVEVNSEEIRSLFKTVACLCPGLKIHLIEEDQAPITYLYREGIKALLEEKVKDKEIINRRLEINCQDGKYQLDLLMTYTSNYSSTIIPYVNLGLTESGPHITQLKTIITREMNKFLKEQKMITSNLTGDELQEGLFVIFNATIPNVSYDAQVKTRVVKADFKPLGDIFALNFNAWMHRNSSEIKMIAAKAIKAKKAKEAAKKARDKVRNKSEKKKSKTLTLPTKLVDSWSKERGLCELFVVEGDSAASGLISGRDSEFQAVFPVRGKVINTYKASVDKILANQEIVNLIKALGLTFDTTNNQLIYNKADLRYDKICIACDADADGQAIKNLLLTAFWWLCPDLILNGHVYVAIPPLFRITTKANQYIYLKDKSALDEYTTKHAGERYIISRNKGLGESDADELSEYLLHPETRNLQQVIVKDKDAAATLLEIVSGKDANLRKAYIEEHGEEAND